MKLLQTWILALTTFLSLVTSASSVYANEAGEKIVFYHHDHLGSVIMATDEDGKVEWKREFEAYGKPLFNDDKSVKGFTGHEYVAESGLNYMLARWYEPELGRFLSPDPVQYQPGNPTSFNRYAYANNSPYSIVDPDGRRGIKLLRKVVDPFLNEAANSVRIVNKKLANDVHATTGVPFSSEGFPIFDNWVPEGGTVRLPGGQKGNHTTDFAQANELAGYTKTPDGYTWHHHEDTYTMQLVPSNIHDATAHTGGVAIGKKASQLAAKAALGVLFALEVIDPTVYLMSGDSYTLPDGSTGSSNDLLNWKY